MGAVHTGSLDAGTRSEVGVEEIDTVLRSALTPVPVRYHPVADAVGATLAEPVTAACSFPIADTAAMDGFAISGHGPRWTLRIGLCTAGQQSTIVLADGEAVRISTGAPTPRGTTAVVRSEHMLVERSGRQWILRSAPGVPRANDTRVLGQYWSAGDELASTGVRVDPALVSVALSAEVPTAAIRGPLRADVLITGDEIRASGHLVPGQVRDVLGPVLPQYLRGCDIGCRKLWRLPDDRALLRSWFELDTDAELVISVGATGRGTADRLRDVLDEIGAHMLIDGVRMRPGGSQIVARLADGRVLLALPGNPLAAIAATLVTGRSVVRALTGRRPSPPLRGRILDAAAPDRELTRVVPAWQVDGGVWRTNGAVSTPHLADLLGAHALALLPPGVGRGSLVEILPLPH